MGSSARSFANSGDDTVHSRVEGIILSRLGGQLTDNLVKTRSLRDDELAHIERLRTIVGINLDDDLANSGGVGDLVDKLDVELGSLGSLGGGNGQAFDRSRGVIVERAQSDLNADPEGIRVGTNKTVKNP